MGDARFAAFGVPAFRRYFTAQFISQAATWFQSLTVALAIAERTGSAYALAGTQIAQFAPTLALSWLAGRMCDRWSPRRIAIVATVLTAATAPALIAVFQQEELSLPWIYAILALGGSASTFSRVAGQSLIYELVGPDLLKNAAIWASTIAAAGRIVGPGLAGAALAGFGSTGALVINAVLAVIAAVAMAAIRESELIPRRAAPGERAAARARLPRATGVLLLLNAAVCFSALNLVVTITALVTLDFDGDATALGLAHAVNAVGSVASGLLITRLRVVTARTATVCVAVFGLGEIILALPSDLAPALAATVVLGLTHGAYQSALAAAVQTSTPPVALGRATSLLNLGTFGTLPFGAIFIGALVENLGPRPTLMICGGVCVVLTAIALPVVRSRWALER